MVYQPAYQPCNKRHGILHSCSFIFYATFVPGRGPSDCQPSNSSHRTINMLPGTFVYFVSLLSYLVGCVRRACRIQYANKALQCLLCMGPFITTECNSKNLPFWQDIFFLKVAKTYRETLHTRYVAIFGKYSHQNALRFYSNPSQQQQQV